MAAAKKKKKKKATAPGAKKTKRANKKTAPGAPKAKNRSSGARASSSDKLLRKYRTMRDFDVTTEPSGESAVDANTGLSFVVQRHDATRLHYDFRLELDGVLKSWAIPKGPSLIPGERRLAVEVEDHPLDYGGFEGAIPEGHYGQGHVLIWDEGTWMPTGDPHEGLAKGKLSFTMKGEKLNGGFSLVRLHGKGGKSEKKSPWLLLKSNDDFAAKKNSRDVTAPSKVPALTQFEPQLATLVDAPPEGDLWIAEPKLDGYRAVASLEDGKVAIKSRSGQDYTARFSEIAEALKALPIQSAVFDGEVCALDDEGRPSFQKMQGAGKPGGDAHLVYFVFDLLFLDGFDVRNRPLEKRKAMLKSILAPRQTKAAGPRAATVLSYVSDVEGEKAGDLLALACEHHAEGIVMKRKDRPHVPSRTRDWVKVKCGRRQELVIVGMTKPRGSRVAMGALLLGVHDDEGELHYVGKVGTGFDDATLRTVQKKLAPLVTKESPASDAPRMKDATWVKPELVCEVSFSEWTDGGALRHPVFLGLREDKKASSVVREKELHVRKKKSADKTRSKSAKQSEDADAYGEATRAKKAHGTVTARTLRGEWQSREKGAPPEVKPPLAKSRVSKRTPAKKASAKSPPTKQVKVAGEIPRGMRLTHPERVVEKVSGLTKLDLARYHATVGPLMLPYLEKRPLALVRCPDGTDGTCFFQKQRTPGMPDSILGSRDGKNSLLYVESLEGLLGLVQFGAVELHGWGARLPDVDHPDWFVIDLDPDVGLPFKKVVDAALALRDMFSQMQLESFVKTTGGKGLHVVVPVRPRLDFDAVKDFTHTIAKAFVQADPKGFVDVMTIAKRKHKIFIDYLRNGKGATAILPYSVRARANLPVAMPVAWEDLNDVNPQDFTVATVPKILEKRTTDPWEAFWTKQELHVTGAKSKKSA